MYSLFNFSSIFQGGGSADPICPYVRTPMVATSAKQMSAQTITGFKVCSQQTNGAEESSGRVYSNGSVHSARTDWAPTVLVRVRFESERAGTPFLVVFWSPERCSGPFRYIAAKFRFHLNESDKFALFGSKMPSASGGLCPPDPLTRGSAPGPSWGPQTPI